MSLMATRVVSKTHRVESIILKFIHMVINFEKTVEHTPWNKTSKNELFEHLVIL